MEEKMYMISDAARQVEVESHVLRYWEEELELPIKRNKLGHRYYTTEDVNRLKRVKSMKEQGFQLKAIRNALKREMEQEKIEEKGQEILERPVMAITLAEERGSRELKEQSFEEKEDKVYRLQLLLKNMMVEAVREGNEEFGEQIKESVLKELDYQFRMQEEREDTRACEQIQREEEHYRKIDELLREKAGKRGERAEKKGKRKKHPFF